MWNQISGSIPKEVGNITSLELLLLNGNQLTGPLPDEIGYLPNLDRIQIDQNQISGPIPKSFANLNKTKHFLMNNNSLSGQIPPELSTLPNLVHIYVGYLPRELANLPSLLILQLDNNHFDGATIPNSYGNMSRLLKLSLRNCSLQGLIPDLSRIPHLAYIDLSSNQLNGSIPPYKLSENMTTIDLSGNNLTGPIPANLSGLPRLQTLSLLNNSLNGSVPASIWQNKTFNGNASLIVDLQNSVCVRVCSSMHIHFEVSHTCFANLKVNDSLQAHLSLFKFQTNNMLSNISGSVSLPANVTVRLQGNPICSNTNLVQFCGPQNENKTVSHTPGATNSSDNCLVQSCPYEYAPNSQCFCTAPLIVGYRLKSPAFRDFEPYWVPF
ncbi:hypothetical protein ACSBR1_033075 [Camellia fascicularis]